MKDRIKPREDLKRLLNREKAGGRSIVFTNGCFDVLHVGHVRYLEEAKSLGDILVVAVNSDRSASTLKGPSRPINAELDRAEVIASLACVDYVTLFDESDPYRIISFLKPDVLVKGGDWTKETTVGRDIVEQEGGRVVIIPYTEGHSTSALIDRILTRRGSYIRKNSRER